MHFIDLAEGEESSRGFVGARLEYFPVLDEARGSWKAERVRLLLALFSAAAAAAAAATAAAAELRTVGSSNLELARCDRGPGWVRPRPRKP